MEEKEGKRKAQCRTKMKRNDLHTACTLDSKRYALCLPKSNIYARI